MWDVQSVGSRATPTLGSILPCNRSAAVKGDVAYGITGHQLIPNHDTNRRV